MVTK
jgi:hypothetical protein